MEPSVAHSADTTAPATAPAPAPTPAPAKAGQTSVPSTSVPPKTAPQTPASSPKPQSRPAQYTDTPASSMRQMIAKRLSESKYAIPHSYLTKDIVVDKLMVARKQLNEAGNKLSVNDFIIKGVATTLRRVPEVNVIWNKTTNQADIQGTVDISVAVAIEGGLITPIVFNADKKGLQEINENVKTLAEKARKGSLQLKEFQGGTFTISNLGMFGVTHFTAVINPPQAVILAVGGGSSKVVVDEVTEKLSTHTLITVTLNFDARAIDTDTASKFLDELANTLEHPIHLTL